MFLSMNDGCRLLTEVLGETVRPGGRISHPVLFLHGGPGGRHNGMKNCLRDLADDYQLVFFDQRGMGGSDRCRKGNWNLRRWGLDAVTVIRQLGIEGCTVFAQSFGVHVLAEMADIDQDVFGDVIIGGASLGLDHRQRVESFARIGGDNAATVAGQFWTRNPSPEVIEAYAERCFPHYQKYHGITNPKIDQEMTRHWLGTGLPYVRTAEKLGKIRGRALVLAGKHDPLSPVKVADQVAHSLNSAEDVDMRLFDAGHAVYLDQREQVIESIRSFLESN